jgi:hypothetical protein
LPPHSWPPDCLSHQAMHATTNREGNSPFGMYKSASPPKVGTDSFMVSNVRAITPDDP